MDTSLGAGNGRAGTLFRRQAKKGPGERARGFRADLGQINFKYYKFQREFK
jgi:hypothetical protein